jgi:hypothetical protein
VERAGLEALVSRLGSQYPGFDWDGGKLSALALIRACLKLDLGLGLVRSGLWSVSVPVPVLDRAYEAGYSGPG